MANIISLNITSRTSGGQALVQNLFPGTKNSTVYSPAVVRGFDTHDIISTIRNNGTNSYFTTREWTRMDISSRINEQIIWSASDSLASIASKSNNFVLLTVLFRDAVRQVNMKSEQIIFVINKMMTGSGLVPDPVSGGTIFEYVEEGDPNPMQYTVVETIAQIIAQGGGGVTPSTMNGYELYVNDIVGNDTTAQFGNPLLPWATFDAAMTAAQSKSVSTTIIITGGTQNPANNIIYNNVNVYIDPSATLNVAAFLAIDSIVTNIYGKGTLIINVPSTGAYADGTFFGKVNIDVGTIIINSSNGFVNAGQDNGYFNVVCDYSIMNANCNYMYSHIGTGNSCFKTSIFHFDNSNQAMCTFYVNPVGSTSNPKTIDFYIARGHSFSSNQGFLCVSNTDSTYIINSYFDLYYDGNQASPGLNAIISVINCTGGTLNLNGTNNLVHGNSTQCSLAIILNSIININDYSITYQTTGIGGPIIKLTGGNSIYTLYGKKKSGTTTNAITLGSTFTSANATTNFGTPTGTAGTDTLHFKGGLKCTYANNSAVGILVANANPNLIIDGGTIEMVNSNTTNNAIQGSIQNMKVLGTGFTRGAISGMTNTISGTNIITDPGVTVNI